MPILFVLLKSHVTPLAVLDIHQVQGSSAGSDHLQVHRMLRIGIAAQRAIFDGEAIAPQV